MMGLLTLSSLLSFGTVFQSSQNSFCEAFHMPVVLVHHQHHLPHSWSIPTGATIDTKARKQRQSQSSSHHRSAIRTKRFVKEAGLDVLFGRETMITPEGYGFSAPASRILREAWRGKGYVAAKATDSVAAVIEAITAKEEDVALVFDDNNDSIIGLFTESDYIRVRTTNTQKDVKGVAISQTEHEPQ